MFADAFLVDAIDLILGNFEAIAKDALSRNFHDEDGHANLVALKNVAPGVIDHPAGGSGTKVVDSRGEALQSYRREKALSRDPLDLVTQGPASGTDITLSWIGSNATAIHLGSVQSFDSEPDDARTSERSFRNRSRLSTIVLPQLRGSGGLSSQVAPDA